MPVTRHKVSGAVAGHAGVVKMVEDVGAVRLTPRLGLVPVEARHKFGAGLLPECRTVP